MMRVVQGDNVQLLLGQVKQFAVECNNNEQAVIDNVELTLLMSDEATISVNDAFKLMFALGVITGIKSAEER